MQTSLVRRVGSLVVAGMLMATVAAPSVAAADPGTDLTVVAPSRYDNGERRVEGTFSWTVVDPAPDYPYAIHVEWGDGTATI